MHVMFSIHIKSLHRKGKKKASHENVEVIVSSEKKTISQKYNFISNCILKNKRCSDPFRYSLQLRAL